ncbi:MAG: DUF2262 domain-containing protein [Planctomycetes bacterium]|nr:DUF2262 domain-containing protein [Planctomycetota bacterium]MCH9726274.1 DUF2262 domain-containing protein [Planctomycetota bacterium]MCH9776662.1 DUF2262 domain-containing protein [Planctomycetota bacterium]MCH9793607.1 DUF2262 domain-containing protein [Planctomycetota bacterium]
MSDDETDDLFAEMEQDNEEFLQRIEKASEDTIVGLVDAGSAAGGSMGNTDVWDLTMTLAAWKNASGELTKEEIRVELPVSKNELSQFMSEIEAYSIVKMKVRMAQHPNGFIQGLASELISTNHMDAELTLIAEELQKPVILQDPKFGSLTLDRSLNSYQGTVKWAGSEISLALSYEDESEVQELLEVARKLWEQESVWASRVADFAVEKLLERKNEIWLDEDESEVTPDEFKSRMVLQSITVYPDGEFEFWHDDGDLFWGHAIQVSGNLTEGLTDIDTPG